MIRTLLATTALAALMSSGAIAQDATPVTPAPMDAPAAPAPAPMDAPAAPAPMDAPAAPAPMDAPAAPAAGAPAPMEADPMASTTSPFEMGAGYTRVDTDNLGTRLIDQPVYSSAGDDAENIGNISDLVFDQDGKITAVVVGVGGFLGIGEKSVAVPFDTLEFTIAADNTERWVVPTSADALTAAPDFVWEEDAPADANAAGTTAPATDGGAMAPATDGGAMAPATDGGAMAPAETGTMAPAAPAP